MPVFLAHGALGSWDEVIFISIGAIFLLMMGISWVKSRAAAPLDEPPAAGPETPVKEPDAPDRFRLE
jgi:hypothetical protein